MFQRYKALSIIKQIISIYQLFNNDALSRMLNTTISNRKLKELNKGKYRLLISNTLEVFFKFNCEFPKSLIFSPVNLTVKYQTKKRRLYKPSKTIEQTSKNSTFLKYQITYPPRRPLRSYYDSGRWKKQKSSESKMDSNLPSKNPSKLSQIQKELQEEKEKSTFACKMVYLLTKALISTKKENSDLKSKLNGCFNQKDESKMQLPNNCELFSNALKESSNSETTSNDPYLFNKQLSICKIVRPGVSFIIREKENQKQLVRRKKSTYSNCNSDDNDLYFKKTDCDYKNTKPLEGSIKSNFRCRTNRSCSNFNAALISSRKSSSNKLASDNEEDINLFLEAERQAQEAFLDEPFRLNELRTKNNAEINNLMNVINNELINKKTINAKRTNDFSITDFNTRDKNSTIDRYKTLHGLDCTEITAESFNEPKNNKQSNVKFNIEEFKTNESDPEPLQIPQAALKCQIQASIVLEKEYIPDSIEKPCTKLIPASQSLTFDNRSCDYKSSNVNPCISIYQNKSPLVPRLSSIETNKILTKIPTLKKLNSKSFITNQNSSNENSSRVIKRPAVVKN